MTAKSKATLRLKMSEKSWGARMERKLLLALTSMATRVTQLLVSQRTLLWISTVLRSKRRRHPLQDRCPSLERDNDLQAYKSIMIQTLAQGGLFFSRCRCPLHIDGWREALKSTLRIFTFSGIPFCDRKVYSKIIIQVLNKYT